MIKFIPVETDFYLGDNLIETYEELEKHLHDDLDDLQVMCKGGVFSSWLEKIGKPDYASKIRVLDTTDANQLYLEICLILGIPPLISTQINPADQEYADAHYNLGLKYENGEGVTQSYDRAALNYRKAADRGHASAQFLLARLYVEGQGVPQDFNQAAIWCRKAADQGLAWAQNCLGHMLLEGQGVPQDFNQAAVWIRKAADQGYASAQFLLASLYVEGQGVPQDFNQAAIWCRKAADQGDAAAQNNLGTMYSEGEGVPQDFNQAAVWTRKAADQEHAEAQECLGELYEKGEGVPQDFNQAATWHRKAADQGNAEAQCNLGKMYAKGQGVPLNRMIAYALYYLSSSSFAESIQLQNELSATMSPKEIEDGQKLAVELAVHGNFLQALEASEPAEISSISKFSNIQAELPKGFVSQGGLIWMPINSSKMTWFEANAYCNNTAINGQTGWRLPTKDELIALYVSGAMKNQGWTSGFIWSSTPDSADCHYGVNLYDGYVDASWDAVNCYVTCVH